MALTQFTRQEARDLLKQFREHHERRRRKREQAPTVAHRLEHSAPHEQLGKGADDRLDACPSIKRFRDQRGEDAAYGFCLELLRVQMEFAKYWKLAKSFEAKRQRVINALRTCAKTIQENDLSVAFEIRPSASFNLGSVALRRIINPLWADVLEYAVEEPSSLALGANKALAFMLLTSHVEPFDHFSETLRDFADELEAAIPDDDYREVAQVRSRNSSRLDFTKRRVFDLVSKYLGGGAGRNKATAEIVNALLGLPTPECSEVTPNSISQMNKKDRRRNWGTEAKPHHPQGRMVTFSKIRNRKK